MKVLIVMIFCIFVGVMVVKAIGPPKPETLTKIEHTQVEKTNNRIEGCALMGLTIIKTAHDLLGKEFDAEKAEPEAKRACADRPLLETTDLNSCLVSFSLLYNEVRSKGTYAPLPREILRTISVACGMIIYGADRTTAEQVADKALKENNH